MLTRRDCLTLTAQTCAAAALMPRLLAAQQQGELIRRPIPSTGEELPIIGLGSSATFSEAAGDDDIEAVRAVLEAMFEQGGTVFDTAPSYGASEEVAGRVVANLGARDRIFWATKLNVAGFRSQTPADPEAAREQVETSLRRLGREPIDLDQVHNIADMDTQFAILEEYKEQGRIRYVGTTSTFKPQYEALEGYMRNLPLDFVGIDYAVDNLSAEERLFPIAQERGIAVMVYMPFGRTRLWDRVEGVEVPDWAREFGAETWAQFFLKFAASHPAVTVVTPATSRPEHMIDNMAAARGRLPDEAERRRMVEFIETLPS
ncbi:MAG: aldo/keto reductase [Gammaproteobacteria bacterium]|nr:aldo/keto reductase [Gammaproteobacteria bacterium]